MSCVRGCTGTPICNALDICCVQFRQDCGKGCDGVADGYSIIQVNADGQLEVCSNVGGVCTCDAAAGGDISVMTLPGDGTAVHDDGLGTTTIINVCDLLLEGTCDDTLVDNLNGTFTHTSIQGVPVIINVCDLLCDSGCIFQDQQFFNLTPTVIGMPIPAGGAYTTVDGPTCQTWTNNSTTEDMYVTWAFNETQLEATNFAATPADISVRVQISQNGGATWFSQGCLDTFMDLNAALTVLQQSVRTLCGWTRTYVLTPGETRTLCFRRQIASTTGFNGNATLDDVMMTGHAITVPFQCL